MNIGYACLTLGVRGAEMKSCMRKSADESRLALIIKQNLDALENIIEYNIRSGIRLFRISSDIIPFGSNKEVNKLPWQQLFPEQFRRIGLKIRKGGLRVSMHPGQYTVLNSPQSGITARAIEDIAYHTQVLDCLQTDSTSKIVLHIGGAYDNKKEAVKRFISHFKSLDEGMKRRIVLENDDKIYTIEEVLEIASVLGVPVAYDNLHNAVNPCGSSDAEWISACAKTWGKHDGRQKVHYSEQDLLKRPGSHSRSVNATRFLDFCESIKHISPDIMLEVKDKNLSAIKCINCVSPERGIKALESEWDRYKYTVLEKSPADYIKMHQLLWDKTGCPAAQLYNIIDAAIQKQSDTVNIINTAQHIWGHFKDITSSDEKERFHSIIERFRNGSVTSAFVKNHLKKLAEKYGPVYLLDSYYFIF